MIRHMFNKIVMGVTVSLVCLCVGRDVLAETPVSFRKHVLTNMFHAEASGLGDIDRDGHGDAIYGPFWYAGPNFTVKHEIYPVKDFDPNQYSNNFMTAVGDVDGDGWLDVLVNEWPGKEVAWFRNPGNDTATVRDFKNSWAKHLVHPVVDNESPDFLDVTGDGKPELVFHTGGVLGFAYPSEKSGTQRWTFLPCSDKESWGQYQHGLGAGDVNGDGRVDLLMAGGWWEQPQSSPVGATQPVWKKHPFTFGTGGGQMHTYDVDGDGDSDVVTSLAGHGYGLSWFEQITKDGALDFVEHRILPNNADENLAGVQFSQLHSVALIDIDGDGLKDIVTGKRFWAHGPKGDPDPAGTPVLYWIKLVRGPEGAVSWVPHKIDEASGVGTQIAVGDINGDDRPDIVVGNKKGGFVFVQEKLSAQ